MSAKLTGGQVHQTNWRTSNRYNIGVELLFYICIGGIDRPAKYETAEK